MSVAGTRAAPSNTRGSTVVAELPPPTARPGREVAIAHDGAGAHVERIRALRTELLLRQREGGGLAIVGPGSGAGRSRLAAELAIAFAQIDEPTLLVDADLRRPRQGKLFGAEGEPGLADALDSRGPAQLHGVAGLPALALLTAGTPVPNPLERLSSERLATLLSGWGRQFRHIVIDTPAADAYADGLAVARHCAAALVVCRARRTQVDALHSLQRQLELTPARVLGCVVTRF